MTEDKPHARAWFRYTNLSDEYERKARFLPGVLSLLMLLPVSAVFGGPLEDWLSVLIGGLGIGTVASVGISHLASAAGNRLQERLWPRWPYDSPTNLWLHPDDGARSGQHKSNLYAAIKRLTNLDIKTARDSQNPSELENVINDAVSALRYRLRSSDHADRLRLHNADYGFARNFTGLRTLWILFAVMSCGGCWSAYLWRGASLFWPSTSSLILLLGLVLAYGILPRFVRQKAGHYAESFLAATIELDRSSQSAP